MLLKYENYFLFAQFLSPDCSEKPFVKKTYFFLGLAERPMEAPAGP